MKITIVCESMFGTPMKSPRRSAPAFGRHSRMPMWNVWLWEMLLQS